MTAEKHADSPPKPNMFVSPTRAKTHRVRVVHHNIHPHSREREPWLLHYPLTRVLVKTKLPKHSPHALSEQYKKKQAVVTKNRSWSIHARLPEGPHPATPSTSAKPTTDLQWRLPLQTWAPRPPLHTTPERASLPCLPPLSPTSLGLPEPDYGCPRAPRRPTFPMLPR